MAALAWCGMSPMGAGKIRRISSTSATAQPPTLNRLLDTPADRLVILCERIMAPAGAGAALVAKLRKHVQNYTPTLVLCSSECVSLATAKIIAVHKLPHLRPDELSWGEKKFTLGFRVTPAARTDVDVEAGGAQ